MSTVFNVEVWLFSFQLRSIFNKQTDQSQPVTIIQIGQISFPLLDLLIMNTCKTLYSLFDPVSIFEVSS